MFVFGVEKSTLRA